LKINQIRDLDQLELDNREKHLKSELFNLQFQLVTGQLTNIKRVWAVKKEIARIKTVIRENQAKEAKSSASEG
jgi:large subunit ribosomal protein L29